MTDHAQLPWSLDSHNHIRSDDDVCIANVWTVPKRAGIQKANAAFIIKCVNSHKVLVKALEKVRGYNVDIAAERINYRPHDHIQIIDEALATIKEIV
jgi:hypothetical protein